MAPHTVWRFNFAGWMIFTFSALAYTWGALRAGDGVGLIASILFLLACFVFLVPVWTIRPRGRR